MLQERVFAHFSALGWTLAEETTVGKPGHEFHPDLLLEKAGKRMAVRISEDPLGTFQIGLFGAQCKRARVTGVVVCESGSDVLEACETARVDFVPAEQVGEPIVVPVARAPRPSVAMVERDVEFDELAPQAGRIVWWRWAIVGLIWVAAIAALVSWLRLIL